MALTIGAFAVPAASRRARRLQTPKIMPTKPTTESYGLGQSGCAAGRREGDLALERDIEARNRSYPRSVDPPALDWGLDERWTGRGGSRWGELEAERITRPASKTR
jgi:hypothetical protein